MFIAMYNLSMEESKKSIEEVVVFFTQVFEVLNSGWETVKLLLLVFLQSRNSLINLGGKASV
jgi:hypothetical protein